MKRSDFVNPNGTFEASGGALTFVPSGLPPQYDQGRIKAAVSEASEALALLDGVAATVPPSFDPLFAAREANHSCLIEGIASSARHIFMRSAGIDDGTAAVLSHDNFKAILQCTQPEWLDGGIDTGKMLLAHGLVMDRYAGGAVSPGRFRTVQNWIGLSGCGINDASYVPPAPTMVAGLAAGLATFLAGDSGVPVPLMCAMAHHQFEAIHPFVDGNGRVGRLLVQMILAERGSLARPLLCISPYLWRNRTRYYGLLRKVNEEGSWDEWFAFFLNCIAESCSESMDLAGRLNALHAKYVYLTGIHKARDLADSLFRQPVTTVRTISTDLRIDMRSAEMVLARAQDAGLIRQIGKAAGRNKAYVAEAVLAEIE